MASRSRSPRRGTAYIGSAEFETWAKNNLDGVDSTSAMNCAFKRCRRLTNFFKEKLSEGLDPEAPHLRSELARFDSKMKDFALKIAKEEVAREESKQKSKKDRKDKRAKRHEETEKQFKESKELIESQNKKLEELQSLYEAMKTEKSADKNPSDARSSGDAEMVQPTPCTNADYPLAIPSAANPLQDVLVGITEEADVAQKKVENIEQTIDTYIARQRTLANDIPASGRKLKELEKMASTIPSVKKLAVQHKANHENLVKEKDKVGVALELAKSKLKDARANVAKLEKQIMTVRSQINRDEARLEDADKSEDESSNHCKSDKLTTIFDTMDRSGCGKINKRDFIKALEYEDVASFFGLPTKIKQEDGSREQMESVFQKIAMDGSEFDLEELKAVYG